MVLYHKIHITVLTPIIRHDQINAAHDVTHNKKFQSNPRPESDVHSEYALVLTVMHPTVTSTVIEYSTLTINV